MGLSPSFEGKQTAEVWNLRAFKICVTSTIEKLVWIVDPLLH